VGDLGAIAADLVGGSSLAALGHAESLSNHHGGHGKRPCGSTAPYGLSLLPAGIGRQRRPIKLGNIIAD
jgi:hypothetical protein